MLTEDRKNKIIFQKFKESPSNRHTSRENRLSELKLDKEGESLNAYDNLKLKK
jgi:hypothetical protein